MDVRTIENIDWFSFSEEVYFTVISEEGITGKVQLNMRSIINDYNHYIEWEEEEE